MERTELSADEVIDGAVGAAGVAGGPLAVVQAEVHSFDCLQADSLQNILLFLSLTDGVTTLSLAKHLSSLKSSTALSAFSAIEKKRFLLSALDRNVKRGSVIDFGCNNNSNIEMSFDIIALLTQFFGVLSSSITVTEESTVSVKVVDSDNDELLSHLGKNISSKNIRAARLLTVTDEKSGIWALMYAFQCTDLRPCCMVYPLNYSRGEKPCERTYSAKKCTNDDCNNPYVLCAACSINCYDCDQAGLCAECIFETPNSGEIVFVCAPCRGFCM